MVQRSGCSQPAKCQNNHQTTIFQPDRSHSRERQQCGDTTVQISFPDLTTVSDAPCVQETNTDTHHKSLANSFEESSTTLTPHSQVKCHQVSLVFPQAEKDKACHKSSSGVLAVMEEQGHHSPYSLSPHWQGRIQ